VQPSLVNYLPQLPAFYGIDHYEPVRFFSYFPMAHIAERVVSHYNAIAYGHTVTCCPDPRQVIAYLPEVRPTFFFAVPRIWEKIKAVLEARIATEPGLDAPELRVQLGLDQAEHVLTGAAPSSVEVLEFFQRLGIELLAVWGP